MEVVITVLMAGALLIVGIYLLYTIIMRVIEPAYMMMYNRPLYVHFYVFPKKLQAPHTALLEDYFKFYSNLSWRRKIYFRHRVAAFMQTYKFVGREGLVVTDEMKVKIAATAVMLTFGMRKYLLGSFSVIMVYLDVFKSANSDDFHKGEFNPKAGIVVFSWKHFLEGLQYNNDNLNLGLHEFAHVLHFDAMRKRRGASAVIYSDMFSKVMAFVADPANRQRLISNGYFREYAYTNQHEFMAVILEHFFETPQQFKQNFPELYGIVKKMINFREG
jgi:Mlc titration factor MtfA (ptsG expression regulator)